MNAAAVRRGCRHAARRPPRAAAMARCVAAATLFLCLYSCSSTRRLGETDFRELAHAGRVLGFDIGYNDDHRLYVEAARWIGTPYRYGGTTRSGIDCSGLTSHVYDVCYGIRLPRQSQAQYDQCRRHVRKRKLKEGDLVFFNQGTGRKQRRRVGHVGIFLKDGLFLHASSSRGVMVSRLDDAYWTTRWMKGGRYKK